MIRSTFSKKERLSSKNALEELFDKGNSANHFPIRLVWLEVPAEDNVIAKIAVSVSKKNFKKAVDRNRIKRLIRESYRKNKHLLEPYCKLNSKTLLISFIYTGKDTPAYREVEAKIILSLKRFQV